MDSRNHLSAPVHVVVIGCGQVRRAALEGSKVVARARDVVAANHGHHTGVNRGRIDKAEVGKADERHSPVVVHLHHVRHGVLQVSGRKVHLSASKAGVRLSAAVGGRVALADQRHAIQSGKAASSDSRVVQRLNSHDLTKVALGAGHVVGDLASGHKPVLIVFHVLPDHFKLAPEVSVGDFLLERLLDFGHRVSVGLANLHQAVDASASLNAKERLPVGSAVHRNLVVEGGTELLLANLDHFVDAETLLLKGGEELGHVTWSPQRWRRCS